MDKKIFFAILIFILLSQFSFAQPPFTTDSDIQISTDGITILYPNNNYHSNKDHLNFFLHPMNSTGYLIDNTQVNCTFHLYEPVENKHVLVENAIPAGEELKVTIPKSSFTVLGAYEYNVWCNSTQGEAGFVSDGFILNYRGKENLNPLIFLVFNVALFIFIFLAFQDKYEFDSYFALSAGIFSLIIAVTARSFFQLTYFLDSTIMLSYAVFGLALISYSIVMLTDSMERGA